MVIRLLYLIGLNFFVHGMLSAQEVEMATGFRAQGKIFVVVAVILIILIGLFVYLFRLEKKLKKLEKE